MPDYAPDLAEVLDRATAAGVMNIVCVGFDIPSSRAAIELAQRFDMVVATVGVHPNDCNDLAPGWLEELRTLSTSSSVVAIGEIGLDYHWHRTELTRQHEVLRAQLELAAERSLPVVIHNREAAADLAAVLRDWTACLPIEHPRGVLHCYGGDPPLSEDWAERFCFSIGGPVTYRNAGRLLGIVAGAPLDRMLLETDSPYLTPHPHRGRRNEPAYVRLVAERVADLHGVSLERVAEVTTQNAAKLFGPCLLSAQQPRE